MCSNRVTCYAFIFPLAYHVYFGAGRVKKRKLKWSTRLTCLVNVILQVTVAKEERDTEEEVGRQHGKRWEDNTPRD